MLTDDLHDEDPDDGLDLEPTESTPGAESGEFVDFDEDPTTGDPGDGTPEFAYEDEDQEDENDG